MNWFPVTFLLTYLITNSIHAWLTEDYRLSGMQEPVQNHKNVCGKYETDVASIKMKTWHMYKISSKDHS